EAAAKPGHGPTANVGPYYYNSNGENEVRLRSPEEFLARQAWKANDWKLIDETLLPALNNGKTRQTHDQLQRFETLYRCDESEFLEKAQTGIARSPSVNGAENTALAVVVDVWVDRNLSIDIQPLVLKQLKQDAASQNGYSPPGYLLQLFQGVAAR